jgi:hypothetical protein
VFIRQSRFKVPSVQFFWRPCCSVCPQPSGCPTQLNQLTSAAHPRAGTAFSCTFLLHFFALCVLFGRRLSRSDVVMYHFLYAPTQRPLLVMLGVLCPHPFPGFLFSSLPAFSPFLDLLVSFSSTTLSLPAPGGPAPLHHHPTPTHKTFWLPPASYPSSILPPPLVVGTTLTRQPQLSALLQLLAILVCVGAGHSVRCTTASFLQLLLFSLPSSFSHLAGAVPLRYVFPGSCLMLFPSLLRVACCMQRPVAPSFILLLPLFTAVLFFLSVPPHLCGLSL